MLDFSAISGIEVLQVAVFILLTVIGWGVKGLIKRLHHIDDQLIQYRREIREELREYVRKEICKAHRASMQKQIEHIQRVYGITHLGKSGMAVVDINDVTQMSDLYNGLTPEQRREHAGQCAFRAEHNEIARQANVEGESGQ